MFFLSLCKRGREAYRRHAVEDTNPLCHEENDALTEDIASSFENSHEPWVERTCRAVRKCGVQEVELDAYDHEIGDYDVARIANAMKDNIGVTSLVLRNLETETEKVPPCLAPIFRDGHSIRSVRLEDSGEEAVMIVSSELARNSINVTTLHLKGNVVCPQGADAIRNLLSFNRSIIEFGFCHNGITDDGFCSIALGLKRNQTLKSLDLLGNSISDTSLSKLAHSITYNKSIEYLCLDFNDFGHFGVQSISTMLMSNTTLKELHLFGNRIDARGGECLARAVGCNSSLKKLILSFNRISNGGATAFAKALTINSTLEELSIPSNQIGTDGMRVWGELLPKMKGLEYLNVGDMFDMVAAESLLKGLEANTRLTILHMESPACDGTCLTESRMDFLLRFNRCGRSLLHSPVDVPPCLWATALAKASNYRSLKGCPDVMYAMLRERPDLFELPK